MQHTTNYNLPQWEASDAIRREDVNGAMAAVDSAIKTVSDASPEIVFDFYVGNGQETKEIYLGRRPKIVIVEPCDGVRNGPNGGIAAYYLPTVFILNNNGYNSIKLTDDGFTVAYKQVSGTIVSSTNKSSTTYYYIAIF